MVSTSILSLTGDDYPNVLIKNFHIVLIISYKIKTIYKILKDSETKDVIKMLKPCARLSPPCQPVNNKFVTQY